MKTLSFAFFLAAVFTIVGCSPKAEVSYDNPPIGILVSQDHEITIHTGPDGPLYSVKGPDGKQLATEISKEELQASFPNLDVSEIWAENSSTPVTKLEKESDLMTPAPR